MKQKYNSTYDFTKLNSIIEDLYKRICETISCNSPIDSRKFNDVLTLLPTGNSEKVFKSFYDEHRINNFTCSKSGCIENIHSNIPILEVIKEEIIVKIKNEKKIDDFIVNNFENWILLMEVNILINLIDNINEKSNSSDIQDKLTSLKSIRYFNEKIINNFYYGIEILFLLQNEYFFKESQMIK